MMPKCEVYIMLMKDFDDRMERVGAGYLMLPGTEAGDLEHQRQTWQAHFKLREHIGSCDMCKRKRLTVPFIKPII